MELKSSNTFIQIDPICRRVSEIVDYWDSNWIDSNIKINISDFKGIYRTNLRTDDFQRFRDSLLQFEAMKIDEIEFTTIEDGINLKGKFKLSGNIYWEVIAISDVGNKLFFSIETENTSLIKLINDVTEILEKFPVVGESI